MLHKIGMFTGAQPLKSNFLLVAHIQCGGSAEKQKLGTNLKAVE